jgi:hypothetical protein
MESAELQVAMAGPSDSVDSAPIPANAANWEAPFSATTMASPVTAH